MSDVASSSFQVPDLEEILQGPELVQSTSSDQFCLHSCYYHDFFLLRSPISINGRPAVIKEGEGEQPTYLYDDETGMKLELSEYSSLVAKRLITYGVWHIDTFYYDQVPLLSVVFKSKTRLKQFLLTIKNLQTELEKTIKEALTKSVPNNESFVDVEILPKLFLASPSVTDRKVKAQEVTLANYSYRAKSWQESKVFDFNQSLFDEEPSSQSGFDEAELSDLQRELDGVIEWFRLGVQLKIPVKYLQTIRKDCHFQTADCRLEMLIKWAELETPTWSKLVTVLLNIGRKVLANNLAKKYGILMPTTSDTFAEDYNTKDGDHLQVFPNYEESISNLEDDVENAKRSRDALTKALETDLEKDLPNVQIKFYTLNEEIKQLTLELKNKEEENQMLKYAKQKLNRKWDDVFERIKRENSEKIKTLSEELARRKEELEQTRELLKTREKELQEKIKELKVKSDHVVQLQNELDAMKWKFISWQEDMDQKLIESNARAQSHEKYHEVLKVKLNNAKEEIDTRRLAVEHANKELAHKEDQISQLSEKIADQEMKMAKLREELDLHHCSPEQLSSEELNEDEEKAIQLLTLIISTNQIKLLLGKTEQERSQEHLELQRAHKDLQKYKSMIPDITKCHAEGPGLHGAKKNKPSEFRLHVLDEDGNHCTGSHVIEVVMMSTLTCDKRELKSALAEDDRNPGVYTVTYTPTSAGPYTIAVKVNGSCLRTGPYSVTVVNDDMVDENGEHCLGEHEISVRVTSHQNDQVASNVTHTDIPGIYRTSFIQDATSDKDFYHNLLVETYKEMPVIPLNQWPPVRKEHYVTLALITNEAMSRHDIFSRGTIRGSVDDVYKKKVPAEFGDVFPKKLSSDKRWMVLIEGRPGSGKSTMVTKVSKDWAEGKLLQDVELFIVVRLRRFLGKENITLRDIFGVYCDNAGVVSSVVDEITKNGGKGVCFAFDGLDEYSAVFKKGNLIYELIHALKLPRASIFMTSRPAGSHKLRNSTRLTQNVEIIGFLEEEIERYIKEYYIECENPEYVKAADLLKYLKSHPNIARMCYLPLHMAMVVYLHEINPDYLPNTETELYKAFVIQTLFRALQREASSPDDEDEHEFAYLPEDKKPIFKGTCQLAFEATVQQKQIFTGKEILESDLPMVVPNKKEFDSLGLLTVDRITAASSLPTKTFSFLYLTLQEFLSAVYLVDHLDQDEQLKVIQEHAGKVHMWVVWKFYSGLSSQQKSSIFLNAFHSIVAQNVSQGLAGLSMMHCAFESQRNEACVDVLSQLGGQVNVQDITLNASDCAAIGYVAIHAHQVLTYLDLSYCHLGPSGIEAFVQQLATSNEKLGKVDLLRMRARTDFNPVGSEGAPSLVKFLKKLPNLGELRLYGNKLKTEKFRFFVPVISDMKGLHTLVLSRNDLETSTGELVSQILGNLIPLHTFYISYNPLKDDGLGAMKQGLLKCLNLKILGLRRTHLTEGAGIHLREVLETLPKLEWIELYQNSLGDQGVIDMLPGLFKAKSLQMLSLVENGISDKGAVFFAAYLKSTDTLKEMRMYYNHKMSDVGKIALRTAVVERPPSKCELKFAV